MRIITTKTRLATKAASLNSGERNHCPLDNGPEMTIDSVLCTKDLKFASAVSSAAFSYVFGLFVAAAEADLFVAECRNLVRGDVIIDKLLRRTVTE